MKINHDSVKKDLKDSRHPNTHLLTFDNLGFIDLMLIIWSDLILSIWYLFISPIFRQTKPTLNMYPSNLKHTHFSLHTFCLQIVKIPKS